MIKFFFHSEKYSGRKAFAEKFWESPTREKSPNPGCFRKKYQFLRKFIEF